MDTSIVTAFEHAIQIAPRAELPELLGVLAALEGRVRLRLEEREASNDEDRFARIEAMLMEIRAAANRDVMLTESECAKQRGKTIAALRKERARQSGPPWIKDGAAVRYSQRALTQWLAIHEQETKDARKTPRFPRAVTS